MLDYMSLHAATQPETCPCSVVGGVWPDAPLMRSENWPIHCLFVSCVLLIGDSCSLDVKKFKKAWLRRCCLLWTVWLLLSQGPQYVCTNFSIFVCTACSGIQLSMVFITWNHSMAFFIFEWDQEDISPAFIGINTLQIETFDAYAFLNV